MVIGLEGASPEAQGTLKRLCNKITWKWCSSEALLLTVHLGLPVRGRQADTAGFQKNSSLVICSGAVGDSIAFFYSLCHVKSTSCKCFLLIKASLQNREIINKFLLCKPLSVWGFGVAARQPIQVGSILQ